MNSATQLATAFCTYWELTLRCHEGYIPTVIAADGAWLGEEAAPPAEIKALLRPYDGELAIWPVSSRMHRVDAADGPQVIEPAEPLEEQPLGPNGRPGRAA